MSIFSSVKLPRVKRSTFILTHENKFTGNFGHLMPIYWNYYEPGVSFKAQAEVLVRFAPMLAPLMHRVNVYTAWFACPIRLLMDQDDFEGFFTGGEDGQDEVVWPKLYADGEYLDTMGFDNILDSPLLDMIGVPNPDLGKTKAEYGYRKFDVMPFRAYTEIYNNYYRDQNLEPEVYYRKFTGETVISSQDMDMLSMKSKCWEKDYFTSALPWAQRGIDVKIPLSTDIVVGFDNTKETKLRNKQSGPLPTASPDGELFAVSDGVIVGPSSITAGDSDNPVNVDNTANLQVSANNSNTINDLRTALSLQRWFERNARVGARYIEQILGHFGVRSDDARLQRPEYLGGSRSPLQVGEVLQTSESTSMSAQATPAGRGVAYDNGKFVKYFTKEHCIIMCLCYVVPKPGYFQGLPAKLQIRDRFDFVWPEFAHLGEQEVRNSEIFYDQVPTSSGHTNKNDETFGYQSRYAQYKYEPNQIHGAFRKSLDFWHLGRKFANLPTLSYEFMSIAHDSNLNRIFAVETNPSSLYYSNGDHLWCQAMINIRAKRPLPYYSIPR